MGRLDLALQLGLLASVLTYPAISQDPGLDLPVSPETFVEPAPWVDPPEDPMDEPAPTFYGEEIESENSTIVYVIDISGSMTRGKLDSAKEECIKSISQLTRNFRFNVVSFSCQVTSWQPALQVADEGKKASAIAWVNALHAGGGTGTGPAVVLALSDKQVMAVALLTDGAPGCGAYIQGQSRYEAHRRMINNANSQRAVINVYGVRAYGDWRNFCQNVAGDSGGSYYDVP